MNERLNKLVEFIFEEHEHTMECEACVEQFTHLSELVAQGANLHDLMPAVEEHLDCCPECHEHYQGLLAIIRAEFHGLIPQVGREEGN